MSRINRQFKSMSHIQCAIGFFLVKRLYCTRTWKELLYNLSIHLRCWRDSYVGSLIGGRWRWDVRKDRVAVFSCTVMFSLRGVCYLIPKIGCSLNFQTRHKIFQFRLRFKPSDSMFPGGQALEIAAKIISAISDLFLISLKNL